MNNRKIILISLFLIYAPGVFADCVQITNGWDCDTQGEAAAHCPADTANCSCKLQATRYVYTWYTGTPCTSLWSLEFDQACSTQPPVAAIMNSQEPPNACVDGCDYEATTGTCIPDPEGGVICFLNYEPTSEVCDGDNPMPNGDEPPECTWADNSLDCDCANNPDHWACQPYSDPPNTQDPPPGDSGGGTDPGAGGPGDDGDPGTGYPGPGQTCAPGDPNCYNESGGVCEEGDENCEVSDSTAGGVDDPDTCDPATENCEGEGTASTSGSCQVQPSCSGDAIQCAILIQSWRNRCTLEDLKGQKPPWENDPDYGRDLAEEAEGVDLSQGLDQAGFASGTCPAAIGVSVFSTTFDIDIQPLCDIAPIIRVFVIIITLLWAGPYVVRSF